jgi:hypothetical protein
VAACAIAEAVPEGVEAVATDDERELREAMRPIRGTTRLLVFAIDGLGRAQMAQLLSSGQAPHTRRLTGRRLGRTSRYEHAYLIPETLSTLPSSTIAGWTALFTGATPAVSGIPGNEFFDRDSETFYAIAPTGVSTPSRKPRCSNSWCEKRSPPAMTKPKSHRTPRSTRTPTIPCATAGNGTATPRSSPTRPMHWKWTISSRLSRASATTCARPL